MESKRKWSQVPGALVLTLLLALSGCTAASNSSEANPQSTGPASGNSSEAGEPSTGDAAAEEPTEIRFFRVAVTQDPTKDRVLLELQKRTNTKLEFVTAPWDQQATKVNTMLASGEVIDVISMDDGAVDYIGHARNGTILPLDDYLKDMERYPIESMIAYDDVYQKFLVDGKSYGIPCLNQPGGGWVAGIRKDWLDKVGLDVPTNLDELYEVFRAFKEEDPDGTGQDDTYAMIVAQIFGAWGLMMRLSSPPVTWTENEDGSLQYTGTSEGQKASLRFVKRLYDEGLINQDVFTIRDRDYCLNDFTAGHSGIGFSPMWAKSLAEVKANCPEAEVELLFPAPHDPRYTNGATVNDAGWSWLVNVLPKTCRNPERVLDLLEYLNTGEGRKLMCTGIEGIHYDRYEDGVFYGISQEEQDKDWDPKDGEGPTGHPLWWGLTSTINGTIDFEAYPGDLLSAMQNCVTFVSEEDKADNPFYEQRKMICEVMAHELIDAKLETASTYSGKLSSISNEYQSRLILEPAENFDAIWDEYVEQMHANGLDEMYEEAGQWLKENGK